MNVQFLFRTSCFTKQLQTTDYKGLLFAYNVNMIIVFVGLHALGQLSQCNRRNTATVLRAVVKSHNGLKGTKVFASGCSGRNLKNFLKFPRKTPCWGPFILKLQAVIACYKRLISQLYQKRYAYTETLTQVL